MFKYYLTYNGTATEIKEPIGFDAFEINISRNPTYHGINVEFSENTLKFFGNAIDILETAYQSDIDIILTFSAYQNNVLYYQGQIDFEEYKKVSDIKSCYVEVKTHEVSPQIQFNNNKEQKIDIDSNVSINGTELSDYPMLRKYLFFQQKQINLVNEGITRDGNMYENLAEYTVNPSTGQNQNIIFAVSPTFEDNKTAEFGTFYGLGAPKTIIQRNISTTSDTPSENVNLQYEILSFNDNEYEQLGATIQVSGTISFAWNVQYPRINRWAGSTGNGKYIRRIVISNGNPAQDVQVSRREVSISEINGPNDPDFDGGTLLSSAVVINESIPKSKKIYLYFEFIFQYNGVSVLPLNRNAKLSQFYIYGALDNHSNIAFDMVGLMPLSTARTAFLHETLSRITESITDNAIKVKSDYYGRTDSNVNATQINGIGSYRTLLNGFRLRRQLEKDLKTEMPLLLSFEDIIKGIAPIDNIGFGFSQENGITSLRVEPYSWFYKNDVIFEINKSNNISRTLDKDKLYSIFKCGYSKFEKDTYVKLDSFHTNREYRTDLKLKSGTLEKISTFIADHYTLEITRRKQFSDEHDKTTSYDNDIFIICLVKSTLYNTYYIDAGMSDAENVIFSTSVYNTRISPARIAKKWLSNLFEFGFGKEKTLKFVTGDGNIIATGAAVIPANYQTPDTDTNIYSENQDFTSEDNIILLPEIIAVKGFPLKKSEYNTIKQNPYGIIKVDGRDCYIKSVKYKLIEFKADFELIPKAN